MRIPLFFNNTARSARADRFRRWLDGHRDLFDVIEPESREDMLRHLAARARHAGRGGQGPLQYGNGAGPLPRGNHERLLP